METQKKAKLVKLMLSALLTSAITIMNTLLIDYCTISRNSLSYHAHLSEPVEKDSVQLRLYDLELQNDGDGMLEDIKGIVQFEGQRIVAFKLKGSPTLGIQDSLSDNAYRLRVASLNPMEKLAIAFLLSGNPPEGKKPLADFRAKGLTAKYRTGREWINHLPILLIAGLLAAIMSSVLVNWFGKHTKTNNI